MTPIPMLSVVMAAYNEEASIGSVVSDHCRVLQQLGRFLTAWEILVVDDASEDATFSILEGLQKRMPELRVVQNPKNQGIFGAYARCYREARGTHIYCTGSDGQWPAENLSLMVPRAVAGSDLIVGVRTNRRNVYSFARRLISFAFNAITWLIFAVDVQDAGSLKLGTRQVFELSLVSSSPFVEAERIAKAYYTGLQIEFVPIQFLVRAHGKAKGASWRNIQSSLQDVSRCLRSYGFRGRRANLPAKRG